MLAYAEGKDIEFCKYGDSSWDTISIEKGEVAVFDWYRCDYRIKQESTYHPFKSQEERVKVKIRNTGEDYVTIIREMTKEQYEFLLNIAQDLNSEGEMYSPALDIDILEN